MHGFDQFLAAIADPRHPEHEALLEWCGGNYDPLTFDPGKVRFADPQRRLNRMLRG